MKTLLLSSSMVFDGKDLMPIAIILFGIFSGLVAIIYNNLNQKIRDLKDEVHLLIIKTDHMKDDQAEAKLNLERMVGDFRVEITKLNEKLDFLISVIKNKA